MKKSVSLLRSILLLLSVISLNSQLNYAQTTATFNYTGGVQTWTVPPCVTSITVVVKGAKGGGAGGGLGASVTATLAVVPGQVLQINVGGMGAAGGTGYNGGGSGYAGSGASYGGGGASDIRIAPYGLGNRVVVAGGGGGAGGGSPTVGTGGAGGCATAATGTGSPYQTTGGGGGSQAAGGTGGPPWGGGGFWGINGSLGQGGNGGFDPFYGASGGGGGGGYYGGGGGGSDGCCTGANGGAGGGGGSSLTPAGGTCTQGTNNGNGQVVITYTNSAPVAGTVTAAPMSVCSGQTTTLTVTGSSGTIQWQMSTDGGATWNNIAGATATTYTTPALTANTCYRVAVTACATTVNSNMICITVNPQPTVSISNTSVCFGSPGTLTATVTPPGGIFSWSPGGQTTQSITVSPASTTTYTCTYIANGCVGTGSGTLTVNPLPTLSVNSTSICSGQTATVTATPSIGGGTFSWAPGGQTTPGITVSPGATTTYTCTYTLGGCTATGNGTVTVNATPTVNVTSTTVCAGTPGTINSTVNPTGGTYSWSPSGQTGPNLSQSPATTTTYTLTYTTAAGCSNTGTGTITVNPQPTVAVNSVLVCSGSPGTLTATPSIPGGTFSWSPGGQTTASITNSPASTTNYTVTYTLNGCSATGTGTITVSANPTPNFSATTVCAGSATQFTDLSTAGVNNWSWDFGDGTPFGTTQNPTHTYGAAGTYSVTLTVGTGTCSGTITLPVTVNAMPQTSFTVAPSCPTSNVVVNNTSTISSGSIASWSWSMPSATPASSSVQTPSFSYATGGTYNISLTATSAAGCSSSATQTVNIPFMPVPDFSFTTVCLGSPTSFTDLTTVTGGTITGWTWVWGDGQPVGTTQNPTHTYAAPGTYTVTLVPTTNAGCTGPSQTHTVTVLAQPVSSFAVTNVCQNLAVAPTNTSTGASTYTWDFGDGTPVNTAQNPTHNYASAGSYTITLTVAASGGCSSVSTQTVNVYSMPVAAFSAPGVCSGNPVVFTDLSTVSGSTITSWSWAFGDGNTSSMQSPTHTYPSAGTYNCTLTVTTTNGCTATITQPVNVFGIPVVAFTPTDVCLGVATQFQNLSTVSTGSITSYLWNFGNGNTSTATNPSYTYPAAGSYTVTLTANSSNGCSNTANVNVNVHDRPVVSFVPDVSSGCSPVCVNFTNNSTIAAGSTISTWNWNLGDGSFSSVQSPSHCYNNSLFNTKTYNVTLTATSNFGCSTSLTMPSLITVYAIPQAEFTYGPQPTTILDPLIVFNNNSLGAGIYQWNFGDNLGTSNIANPSHQYVGEGTYVVTLIASNQFGCTDSVAHQVIIGPEFMIYVPNAFTPDGDGINDLFIPFVNGINPDKFELMIFNRWGEMIFRTDQVSKGWDGTHKGVKVKEDTYVWKIKAHDVVHGERKEYYGSVNLLRGTDR